MSERIEFYGVAGEYGFMSNFAPYPIQLKAQMWATSEHYFQAHIIKLVKGDVFLSRGRGDPL